MILLLVYYYIYAALPAVNTMDNLEFIWLIFITLRSTACEGGTRFPTFVRPVRPSRQPYDGQVFTH